MTQHAIIIERVCKRFGKKAVLRNLNLSIPRGSVTGLIGRNGAGKTTLLRCLLGLLHPEAGSITVLGEPARALTAQVKARIGYAPQTPELPRGMTVHQATRYVGAFFPSWNGERVGALLRAWELPSETKISALSRGEAQKLSIILAIGHEPELLVLDEPAAGLDPVARRRFLRTILEMMGDERRTILFSTHHTPDLERVADHVALLKDGGIWFSGALDGLKESIQRLHIRSSTPIPDSFYIPGMLSLDLMDHEAIVCVQGIDPTMMENIETTYAASIEVRNLNLEEIFMEVHRA